MKTENSIFEQSYKIRSININSNKRLGLYGLLGILQDCASEHAFKLNFGYETMLNQGSFWVLVRQILKMDVWPEWHDTITIKTWTIATEGFYAIREFEVFLNNNKIGECSTTWMILDTKTRKPKEISDVKNYFVPRKNYRLNIIANKIKMPEKMELQKCIEVKISDLDMNNHVNNIKYSQWILDTIPFEYHKNHSINEFEINFLTETFLGDKICCYSSVSKHNNNEVYFSGKNEKTTKAAFLIRMLTQEH